MPAETTARYWLERWDRQQETYMADREERFAVIADVVEDTSQRPDPLILDLGCGPGSLSTRLLDRMPAATVIGVDADPVLLGIARTLYGERPGLRLVDHDLRTPGWPELLGNTRPFDAVVSTTALHWLTCDELDETYRQAAKLLRSGGVLVNGDHLFESNDRPALRRLTRSVRERRASRVGVGGEDWEQWWEAIAVEPDLAELLDERTARAHQHQPDSGVRLDDHLRLLREHGFAEVGTVWQSGDDRVLVAIR